MIQKGIIEKQISSYQYKVRVPRYDKVATDPSATSTDNLPNAIVNVLPGTEVVFNIGDIVLVDYENDELNAPVILGMLYNNNSSSNSDNVTFNNVQNSLIEQKEQITNLSNTGLYTHLKYSNDNGVTLTSLYEYYNVESKIVGQNRCRVGTAIEIDPASSTVYWSIIKDGVNYADLLPITTTIYSTNVSGEVIESKSFTDKLIEIPLTLQHADRLFLDFKIIETDDFNDYHIVLTTDKNTVGTVYGTYLGICISENPIAPDSPSEYTWSTFQTSITELINTLTNEWKPRIQRTEQSLYGFNYDDETTSDGTGLLDGIRISEDTVDIHGAKNKDIIFNTRQSMYIDNAQDALVVKELNYKNMTNRNYVFAQYHDSNGHLTLIVKEV